VGVEFGGKNLGARDSQILKESGYQNKSSNQNSFHDMTRRDDAGNHVVDNQSGRSLSFATSCLRSSFVQPAVRRFHHHQ
jgi:hypothetical protein